MTAKVTRNSNIEILRIISIAMIVLSHFSLYGNWNLEGTGIFKKIIFLSFDPLGPAGAAAFFIITGYFMIRRFETILDQLRKSTQKVVSIWFETVFYLFTVTLILWCLGRASFIQLVKSLFPISTNAYWFISAYIFLMFLTPFLNFLLRSLNKRDVYLLVLVLIFMLVFDLMGNGLINNVFLAIGNYSIGALFSFEREHIGELKTKALVLSILVIYAIDILSVLMMLMLHFPFGHAAHFTTDILATLLASNLFLLVLQFPQRNSRSINKIASSVLAVYLITEAPVFRYTLWHQIVNMRRFQDSPLILIYGLLCVLVIFTIGMLIDFLRQAIFKSLNINRLLAALTVSALSILQKLTAFGQQLFLKAFMK